MADDKTFTKEELDAAVKTATDKIQESIDKLETKNAELVGDLRKARKAGEIKPEDLDAAEKRADDAEKARADLEKQIKTLTVERDKAVKSLEAEQGVTHKLLVQDGLKSALIANGVKDEDFIDTLTAKFAGTAKVVSEGDERKVMLGDKALADAIKEFAGSDSGKKFVAAPVNGGGGAGGGNKKADAKTMTRSAYNALDQNAKAEAGMQSAKGELVITDDA